MNHEESEYIKALLATSHKHMETHGMALHNAHSDLAGRMDRIEAILQRQVRLQQRPWWERLLGKGKKQ